jgi:hypothetical protein
LKTAMNRVVQKLQFLQAKHIAAMHGGHVWLRQQPLKTCSISNRVIRVVRKLQFPNNFRLKTQNAAHFAGT